MHIQNPKSREYLSMKNKRVTRSRFQKILSLLTAAAVMISGSSTPLSAAGTLSVVNPSTYIESPLFSGSKHDMLGIAQNFHLFSDGAVTLTAHTNGNIAADTLYAGSSAFGTRNVSNEISYVRSIKTFNGFSNSTAPYLFRKHWSPHKACPQQYFRLYAPPE